MTCWDYLGGWILPHVILPHICHDCQWPMLSAGQNSVDSDLGNCDESWSMIDLPIESVEYKYRFVSINTIQRYKGRLFLKNCTTHTILALSIHANLICSYLQNGGLYIPQCNLVLFFIWFHFWFWHEIRPTTRSTSEYIRFNIFKFLKMFSLQHSILQWVIYTTMQFNLFPVW